MNMCTTIKNNLPLHFQLCLDTYYWTAVNQFFVWGSLAAYFAITFTMYSNGMFLIFTSSFPFIGEQIQLIYRGSLLLPTSSNCSLPKADIAQYVEVDIFYIRPTIIIKQARIGLAVILLRPKSPYTILEFFFSNKPFYYVILTAGLMLLELQAPQETL